MSLKISKYFWDDLIQLYIGTTKQIHELYYEINKIHPNLKFTMVHTTIEDEPEEDRCNCEPTKSIPYLDTSLSLENGKVDIDLFKKKTDRNQYLLPSSCHPKTVTKSIPFSLSLRIVRICIKPENRDQRLADIKELLLARKYLETLIDRGIQRAVKFPRKVALLKIKKQKAEKYQYLQSSLIPDCLQFSQ